jgi:hypothetical protein
MWFEGFPLLIRLQCFAVSGFSAAALVIAPRLQSMLLAWIAMLAAPLLASATASSSIRRWLRVLRMALGPIPVGLDLAPPRPSLLDPPTLRLPAFVPPQPRLPPRPPERLPGQWERCNVCNRPLTDPTSRWRGIGPDCFARTRVHWPQGPENPALWRWEREVQQIREDFAPVLARAIADHKERLYAVMAEHREQMGVWEARLDERRKLQSEYDAASNAWAEAARACQARHDAWRSDPRHLLIERGTRSQSVLLVGAVASVIGGLWLSLA